MARTLVIRKKGTRTCKSCGSNLGANETKCHNCGSMNVAKILVTVKKEELDGDDLKAETSEEEAEDEDLGEEDFEGAEDEEDSEDEDSEDEGDDEDEDDDDEEEENPVTKRIKVRRVAKASSEDIHTEILVAALQGADDISKAVATGDDEVFTEAVNKFFDVLDESAESWLEGDAVITKEDDKKAKLKRLRERLREIRAQLKGSGVEKADDEDDDDDEGEEEDVYKNLHPDIAAKLKKAEELVEKNESEKYETIAKSYANVPADTAELARALRFLSENNEDAYKAITKTISAANENLKTSEVFKSYGSPQSGTGDKTEAIAKSFMEKDKDLTLEQAYDKAYEAHPELYEADSAA